jgi:hypothetical protein
MQSLPHQYSVEASAQLEGPVAIASEGLETFSTAPPLQYGGPGDQWSPETLLIAAVHHPLYGHCASDSPLDLCRRRCGEGWPAAQEGGARVPDHDLARVRREAPAARE